MYGIGYTEEQIEWLKVNFPIAESCDKATELFNKVFNANADKLVGENVYSSELQEQLDEIYKDNRQLLAIAAYG